MTRLDNCRVLVVGAGTAPSPEPDAPVGNGRAIAVAAARQGASVACADISEESAQETADWIRREKRSAEVIVADVADPEACERLVREAHERMGGLDGVVLNVGIAGGFGLEGTSVDDWDRVFAVNLRAHFLISKATLAVMGEGGSLVYIGSVAGLKPGTNIPSYDTSKAALAG